MKSKALELGMACIGDGIGKNEIIAGLPWVHSSLLLFYLILFYLFVHLFILLPVILNIVSQN